ncbi:hypothetical protein CPB85DRAFT_1350947 [Mucidula mucida]|nr:hypothetical protein CPB85DRAFT_1350947 [Mucidula mucida]
MWVFSMPACDFSFIECVCTALGAAIARAKRRLVYGGGSTGLMGEVSAAALKQDGDVIGITPAAMMSVHGSAPSVHGVGRLEEIVVDTMHERKVEMAKRVDGFVALPGGFGTYEELMEVTTWTQIGMHAKPVIILNVLSFYDPIRGLIQNGIAAGFIAPINEKIVVFVDGPADLEEHASFDWGSAALEAVDAWTWEAELLYDWTVRRREGRDDVELGAT